MEQKKLLWIIFSVTLFFAVVVGAGFIWFYPERGAAHTEKETQEIKEEASRDFDPVEWVRTSDEYPGMEDGDEDKDKSEDDGFIIVYGENGDRSARRGQEEGERVVVTELDEGPEARREEEPEGEAERWTSEKPRTTDKQEAPKTEPSDEEEKSYTGTKKTIRTVEYWIQTGSYTSKTRAEKVRDQLEEKGFTSRVAIKEIDDTVYYRVRIGPYQNEGEADKFLTWVKDIKDFEKSYVSKVYRTKVVRE